MRVALTGSSGFIGRSTVVALEAAGHVVLPLSTAAPPDFAAWFAEKRPDALLHLGWYVGPGYLQSPENLRCLEMGLRLLSASEDCEVVLGVGSAFEYGPVTGVRQEKMPVNPQTPYARAKVDLSRALEGRTGRFVWARIFNVYGEDEGESRLIAKVRAAVASGSPLSLADGEQRRDWLHVEDVARALVLLLERGHGVYNVCSGKSPTLREFLASFGREELFRFGERAPVPGEDSEIWGDNQRLSSLGWHAER